MNLNEFTELVTYNIELKDLRKVLTKHAEFAKGYSMLRSHLYHIANGEQLSSTHCLYPIPQSFVTCVYMNTKGRDTQITTNGKYEEIDIAIGEGCGVHTEYKFITPTKIFAKGFKNEQ